jgi:23S rRNA (cytosine1962-C5)-methyltransferase
MEAPSRIRSLPVSRRAAARVASGHPWVFANEIRAPLGELVPGEAVGIADPGGRSLGVGYANPRSLIAVRILSTEDRALDVPFFAERLRAAAALRRRVRPGASAYRLCHGEGDDLPGLIVDRYDDVYVVASHTAGIDRLLPQITDALVRTFHPRGILVKSDSTDRRLEGVEPVIEVVHGEVPDEHTVEIDGVRFVLDLRRGQKTGFFFDQADNRRWLAAHAGGARVLDVFCYVGAWALACARAGAKSVRGYDGSADAVAWAARSAVASGLDTIAKFEKADAFAVLRTLADGSERFDVVVLDPPAFVKSKKKIDEGMRGYREINRLGMALVAPGGILATSSCSRHVDHTAFVGVLQAAADDAKRSARILAVGRQGPDHPVPLKLPEAGYLDCVFLEVR